jgi:hypothetical protein
MKQIISTIILCTLILTGCQKSGYNKETNADNSLKSKVSNWLGKQQFPSTPIRNQRVQSLVQHLDYERIYTEVLNNGESFIIVPVRAGFQTINNKNKNPLNSLVLTVDKNDKIRSGRIMQFVPESGPTPEKLPANTIHNIFNGKPVEAAGSYTSLAVWDHYMFQLTYKDGELTNAKMMEPEGGYANYISSRTSGCIDWYIVTTLYLNGQIVDQQYEYIGTTCDGCVPQEPTLESIGCEGNGDGSQSGSPPPPMPEPVNKQVQWTVKADAEGGWHVDSYEFLQGAKPAPPLVAYFTAITHQNDAIFNSVASNQPGYSTWHKLAISTGVTGGGSSCQSQVAGKVTCAIRQDVSVSNAKGWLAVTEFP